MTNLSWFSDLVSKEPWLEGSRLMGWTWTRFLWCFLGWSVQSPCPPGFWQNILHCVNEVRVTQGNGTYVMQCWWLEKHLLLHVYCCFKPKYFTCVSPLLEIPSSYCKLTFAMYVSLRSQRLFINDEPWCWYTVVRAAGFLFLSATLSIMQHSGKLSRSRTGTHRQDPSCALSW